MNTNEIPKAHPELLDALHRQDEKVRKMKLSDGFTEKVMSKVKSEKSRFARKRKYRIFRKIAAIFLAAVFLGGLAFAAYRAFSPAKETPTEKANCQMSNVKCQLSAPVRFSDVRLDSILTVVSKHYGKTVRFRDDAIRELRMSTTWNSDQPLAEFLGILNEFDGLRLSTEYDTIFVDSVAVEDEQ